MMMVSSRQQAAVMIEKYAAVPNSASDFEAADCIWLSILTGIFPKPASEPILIPLHPSISNSIAVCHLASPYASASSASSTASALGVASMVPVIEKTICCFCLLIFCWGAVRLWRRCP